MNYFAAVLPLIIGAVLDSIFGDPYSLPHPVRLVGRLISGLESFVRSHMAQGEFSLRSRCSLFQRQSLWVYSFCATA